MCKFYCSALFGVFSKQVLKIKVVYFKIERYRESIFICYLMSKKKKNHLYIHRINISRRVHSTSKDTNQQNKNIYKLWFLNSIKSFIVEKNSFQPMFTSLIKIFIYLIQCQKENHSYIILVINLCYIIYLSSNYITIRYVSAQLQKRSCVATICV